MQFWDNVQIELIKAASAWLTLFLGWFLGQRIIAYWDIRKKRQELDIATATEFHKLYGEFKEVSRLWRAVSFTGNRSKPLSFPDDTRLELLKRATASEGKVEAIIVKLVTERVLGEEDIRTLGLFRQAYQQLREKIRDGAPLEWTYGAPDYTLYNDLASKTACIIASNKIKRRPESDEAPNILRKITAVRPEEWQHERNRLALPAQGKRVVNVPAQFFRAGIGAVILNSKGLILTLERTDISGAWQLPQGGLEASEEPLGSALREVAEETGIAGADLELLDRYPRPLVYELPASVRSDKTGRGQVQYWFLFRFRGRDDTIDVKSGGEFHAWKWISFQDVLHAAADFREPIYRKLVDHFGSHISQSRAPVADDEVSSGVD